MTICLTKLITLINFKNLFDQHNFQKYLTFRHFFSKISYFIWLFIWPSNISYFILLSDLLRTLYDVGRVRRNQTETSQHLWCLIALNWSYIRNQNKIVPKTETKQGPVVSLFLHLNIRSLRLRKSLSHMLPQSKKTKKHLFVSHPTPGTKTKKPKLNHKQKKHPRC